jgi:hypothetical protein
MALINCPECNREISDQASSCPNCAFPINKKSSLNFETNKRGIKPDAVSKEGCFLQTLNIGCLIFGVLIAIAVLLAIFSKSRNY